MAMFEQNIIQFWRQHFIQEEKMLEISCTNVTPYQVLKTSGHVDRFTDIMTEDTVTHEVFRADHMIEQFVENMFESEKEMSASKKEELSQLKIHADTFSIEQMTDILEKNRIKSPSGNPLSKPHLFNLMFPTSIGPSGKDAAFELEFSIDIF